MTSRERILDAAIPVFARKGRYGARMEDIAALAHINKAMIYYIFHSKDELYLEVLKTVFNKASFSISDVVDGEENNRNEYIRVLENFISAQITFFSDNQYYTKIMVDAMSSGAEEIPVAIKYFKSNHGDKTPTAGLRKVIERGKAEKFIRNINTDHLMINIIGMVIIHFFSQSITDSLDIEVKDERVFLEQRRKSIIDLVLNSIFFNKPAESKRKSKKS